MSPWIVSLPDRLDVFLLVSAKLHSRGEAQRLIEAGKVSVNETVTVKPAFRLQEGDQVALAADALEPVDDGAIEPADLKLEVLFEDDACLVVNKPAGLAVHPGAGMLPGEKTVLHGIAHLFNKRKLPFSSQAVLVHRLDRETTGCLLIAKSPKYHVVLQKQFEERTVRKTYLAIVAGVPDPTAAVIDAPIGRSVSDRTKMAVQRTASTTREAQTTYSTLSSSDHAALLSCDLHTGRTHQIRVHLHSIGYPILGDDKYTNQLSERLTEEYAIRGICLHAWTLTFVSPAAKKKEQTVTAPLPATFTDAMKGLGLKMPKT